MKLTVTAITVLAAVAAAAPTADVDHRRWSVGSGNNNGNLNTGTKALAPCLQVDTQSRPLLH